MEAYVTELRAKAKRRYARSDGEVATDRISFAPASVL